jgi:hypothetical protein
MSNRYRGLAIYDSCQVSACLAKWLQRRRFLKIDQSRKKQFTVATMFVKKWRQNEQFA